MQTCTQNRFTVRSQVELCRLNTAMAWKEEGGTYSPVVSVYTAEILRSGLPFHADPEPVRFARNFRNNPSRDEAVFYAVRLMNRFNWILEKGLFDGWGKSRA